MNTSHKVKKSVFIGGKQIGVNCLNVLLEHGIKPDLVICNVGDGEGKKNWHDSLLNVAEVNNLNYLKNTRVDEFDVIKMIENISPEIIFCIGGMHIIPKSVLSIPRLGCVNIHPSLLPKYRGRYSTAHAIFNGEKYSGVTIHWMDEGIDTGPIIMQEKIEIKDTDTARTLYDKFTKIGTLLFKEFLNLWITGQKIPSLKQDENEASYYPKSLPAGGEIDWSWDGAKIKRFIRAMTFEPFGSARFKIGNEEMLIVNKKYVDDSFIK